MQNGIYVDSLIGHNRPTLEETVQFIRYIALPACKMLTLPFQEEFLQTWNRLAHVNFLQDNRYRTQIEL